MTNPFFYGFSNGIANSLHLDSITPHFKDKKKDKVKPKKSKKKPAGKSQVAKEYEYQCSKCGITVTRNVLLGTRQAICFDCKMARNRKSALVSKHKNA